MSDLAVFLIACYRCGTVQGPDHAANADDAAQAWRELGWTWDPPPDPRPHCPQCSRRLDDDGRWDDDGGRQ